MCAKNGHDHNPFLTTPVALKASFAGTRELVSILESVFVNFNIAFDDFFLLLVIGSFTVFSQAQLTSTHIGQAQEIKLYGNAHPYLNESESALKKIVPELRDMESASGQDELPVILNGVGASVKGLLHDVPNLISNETVGEDVSYEDPYKSLPGHRPVQTAETPDTVVAPTLGVRMFNYIVLVHESEGERILEEYRTNPKGKPVSQDSETPSSVGFVSAWVMFSPENRGNARFHYLGQQRIGGHSAFVVAFAQIPGSINHPGMISFPGGGTIPMLSQGVAWIDASNFHILRLRTDLLASQPQVGLSRLTAMIQFGTVRIDKLGAQLWLPIEVKINLEANGRTIQELHKYTKFRLYKAETKIVADVP